jgi:enoyl-CoA hydratase
MTPVVTEAVSKSQSVPASESVVSVRTTDHAVLATLDDGRVNALALPHVRQLRDAVVVAVEAALPLVVAGRDGVLSAGFELTVVRDPRECDFLELLEQTEALCVELLTAPVPVVVACTGHAVAAGVLPLLCADHRVGRFGDYAIGFTEVRLGMVLPDFALTLARSRLDPRCLPAATVLAEAGTPERAVEVGFLDTLAADSVAAALEVARDLAALVGPAFTTTKRLAHEALIEELQGQSLLAPDRRQR